MPYGTDHFLGPLKRSRAVVRSSIANGLNRFSKSSTSGGGPKKVSPIPRFLIALGSSQTKTIGFFRKHGVATGTDRYALANVILYFSPL
jgi:hypothetical protein